MFCAVKPKNVRQSVWKRMNLETCPFNRKFGAVHDSMNYQILAKKKMILWNIRFGKEGRRI